MDDDAVFSLLDTIEGRARPNDSGYFTQPEYQHADDAYQPHSHRAEAVYNARGGVGPAHHDYEVDYAPEAPFDEFDQALLRQPTNDRRRQAQEGRARLSLPPASGSYAGHRPVAPTQGYEFVEQSIQGRRRRMPAENPHPAGKSLSQFAYNPSSTPHASSSPNALLSSPAVRASQRRQGFAPPSRPQRNEGAINSIRRGYEEEEFRPDFARASRVQPGGPPTAQGIELIPTRELPDRFRSVFPFPLFNAVQSKCFKTVYGTNDNFVVSAPTGSGKTAIFELAILRLIDRYGGGSFKAVYQAPTKALCFERQRDWTKKFGHLDLTIKELTGDTSNGQLRDVQTADVIVTTPEKWDSMTRKWTDHERLMQMVKLFLVDEVHILKEDRGATLEAVVSRMKSVGSDVRFIALSATVPNFADIAAWLGRDPTNQNVPAAKEYFGENFRPVQLQKHVVGFAGNQNDFGFDSLLGQKLPSVIAKYSQRKPIMVFCFTRKSCEETAKALGNWWAGSSPKDRYWGQPSQGTSFVHPVLRDCATAGVAFHHAGLDLNDRQNVEKAYLGGDINVICCTSTLAVGVNLPCHIVIIKNTVCYAQHATKEYSDLEIMQMLGRAGRPQFDDSGVAVIMTKTEKVPRYQKMVSGREVLESRLHLNLVEHLNSEIGLGTVTNVRSAKKWLTGTFLYVRLQENPDHYYLEGDIPGNNLDERLERVCSHAIELLKNHGLAKGDTEIKLTEYGKIMARYYIRLETMKNFLGLELQAKTSEILSAISAAEEFKEIRFRQGDKTLYKALNQSPATKFSIPVNLSQTRHKVSLIIQSILGGVELPTNDETAKHKSQYNQDTNLVFQHVHRLIRCIVDCALAQEDSVTARNALAFSRSLCCKAWDDSPLTMKQFETIGPVAVRKLVNAGIRSIEALEETDAHRIEMALGKHPPAGMKLLKHAKEFPKLRVSLRQMKDVRTEATQAVTVNLKAEIGFMNEKPPLVWLKTSIYVCILAETSDGKMVHFRRISASKLGNGQDVLFSAELRSLNQVVSCYVMCDGIAGTMQQATVRPEIPAHLQARLKTNISRRRSEKADAGSDEFDDGGLADSELEKAVGDGFLDIDAIPHKTFNSGMNKGRTKQSKDSQGPDIEVREPTRLENGKWACLHKCKDKSACRHICCRDGLENPPKGLKNPGSTASERAGNSQRGRKGLNKKEPVLGGKKLMPTAVGTAMGTSASQDVEHMDLTNAGSQVAPQAREAFQKVRADGKRNLHGTPPVSGRVSNKKPRHAYQTGSPPRLSFLQKEEEEPNKAVSDYDDNWMDDMSSLGGTTGIAGASHSDDDYMFDADFLQDVMAGFTYSEEQTDARVTGVPSGQTRGEPSTDNQAQSGKHPTLGEPSGSETSHQQSTDDMPPPLNSTSGSTSSNKSHRIPRKMIGSRDTASPRPDSASNNSAMEPQGQNGPAPKAADPAIEAKAASPAGNVVVPASHEDIEPWLFEEFGAHVDFI